MHAFRTLTRRRKPEFQIGSAGRMGAKWGLYQIIDGCTLRVVPCYGANPKSLDPWRCQVEIARDNSSSTICKFSRQRASLCDRQDEYCIVDRELQVFNDYTLSQSNYRSETLIAPRCDLFLDKNLE